MTEPPADLLLLPPGDQWRPRTPSPEHAATRASLGLPTDRPIAMTGHQVGFFHPGILAKYFALESFAARTGACKVYLAVDQDDHDPVAIRTPTLDAGRWRAEAVPLLDAKSALTGVPAASRSPGKARPVDHPAPLLSAAFDALRAHEHEPTLARQVHSAVLDVLKPWATPDATLDASALAPAMHELIAAMADDPAGCTEAYNDAVAAHPAARMRPLSRKPDLGRYELPLWRLRSNTPRQPVYSTQLSDIPIEQLAPRALLMTGFLRARACDLFIHGTGGGVYDPIAERWLSDWLGWSLAPAVVVSATLRLDLDADTPEPREIDHAVWRAHHARHDPALLGDADAASRKAQLVARIAEAVRTGEDTSAMFDQVQSLLRAVRDRHAARLAEMDARAQDLRARRSDAAIVSDRTYSFLLHDEPALRDLAARIDALFTNTSPCAPTGSSRCSC